MPTGFAGAKTNGLAIAALICGIGQVLLGFLAGIPAIILGHMARRQIRQTGEQGAGMAMAGLILGYIGVALSALFVIIIIIGVASSSST
jgi:threonine/homoserine/homoserine lactone efflux protein